MTLLYILLFLIFLFVLATLIGRWFRKVDDDMEEIMRNRND